MKAPITWTDTLKIPALLHPKKYKFLHLCGFWALPWRQWCVFRVFVSRLSSRAGFVAKNGVYPLPLHDIEKTTNKTEKYNEWKQSNH
ncbi:MAG: hypothetical protein J5I98_23870 [Phaeodactylibacter sp.]|nr:hypothetical protein [Phaeodactylibacter sp.]